MSSLKNVSPDRKALNRGQMGIQNSREGSSIKKENEEGFEDESKLKVELLPDPEDYLEENESLDLDLGKGNEKVWLVKLPRYLGEKWKDTGSMSGQKLGTVKIKPPAANNSKLQVKLMLDEKPENQNIPHSYDMSILNTQVRNSYVFKEENLSRFKQELNEMGEMPELPELEPPEKEVPRSLDRAFRIQKNTFEESGQPGKKQAPFVRTIPKKTALAGKICHDCQVIPSKSDKNYGRILQERHKMQQVQSRPKVTFLEDMSGVLQSNAGPSIKGNNTSVFLKSNLNKAKTNEGRAIRMPKKDLLDLLFRLFEEYEYWSMKGLKERTKQPESYLKESLESIANLIKKGPYTSKYSLKPEYKKLRDAERAARLGLHDNKEEEENNQNEEDIEEVDMEDVI